MVTCNNKNLNKFTTDIAELVIKVVANCLLNHPNFKIVENTIFFKDAV